MEEINMIKLVASACLPYIKFLLIEKHWKHSRQENE